MSAKTHYDTLGVPRDASLNEIAAAYQTLLTALDPRRSASPPDPADAERLIAVHAAWKTLGDAERRYRYDEALQTAALTELVLANDRSATRRLIKPARIGLFAAAAVLALLGFRTWQSYHAQQAAIAMTGQSRLKTIEMERLQSEGTPEERAAGARQQNEWEAGREERERKAAAERDEREFERARNEQDNATANRHYAMEEDRQRAASAAEQNKNDRAEAEETARRNAAERLEREKAYLESLQNNNRRKSTDQDPQ